MIEKKEILNNIKTTVLSATKKETKKITTRVIIQFKDRLYKKHPLLQLIEPLINSIKILKNLNIGLLEFKPSKALHIPDIIKRFADAFLHVEYDHIFPLVEPTTNPYTITGPYYEMQWYYDELSKYNLGFNELKKYFNEHNIQITEKNRPIIAILDNCFDYLHEDLKHAIWINNTEHKYNDDNMDNDYNGYIDDIHGIDATIPKSNTDHNLLPTPDIEENFHGTAVAGCIVANNNNIGINSLAPYAKIILCKLANKEGMNLMSIINGLDYIITLKKRGVNITAINMSLGYNYNSTLIREQLKTLSDLGVISVVAAGNENVDLNTVPTYPASYDIKNMLRVGAISEYGNKASFSNYSKDFIDIWSPGTNVLSTIQSPNIYGFVDGTSFASPITASCIAVLHAIYPEYTAEELINKLLDISISNWKLEKYSKNTKIVSFQNIDD